MRKLKIYKTQLVCDVSCGRGPEYVCNYYWIVDYGHRITAHHTWTAALNEALYNLEALRHAR